MRRLPLGDDAADMSVHQRHPSTLTRLDRAIAEPAGIIRSVLVEEVPHPINRSRNRAFEPDHRGFLELAVHTHQISPVEGLSRATSSASSLTDQKLRSRSTHSPSSSTPCGFSSCIRRCASRADLHQSGIAKGLEMLRDCRGAHRKAAGDVSGAQRSIGEQFHDAPACRIGEDQRGSAPPQIV